MSELQLKYCEFIDILQENYHDTVDQVSEAAGVLKRFLHVVLYFLIK